MEHSPDGKAYILAHGAQENDPKPRPCVRPGKPGELFEIVDNCDDPKFNHGNLSWISADQVYLARVIPSPETINDLKAWEFFAGHDEAGEPIWTYNFDHINPLLEWNNHMGCATATYVPGLNKYLMCVTDGWPTTARMTSYILEADADHRPLANGDLYERLWGTSLFPKFPEQIYRPRWSDSVVVLFRQFL